jgi:hypothetical protein
MLYLCGLAAVAMLTTAASAMGQAAVDQYVPIAKSARHHGSGEGALEAAEAATTRPGAPPTRTKKGRKTSAAGGSPAGPSDGDGGGYPLTAFVLLVILLFLAGLAARYLPKLIERVRPGHSF